MFDEEGRVILNEVKDLISENSLYYNVNSIEFTGNDMVLMVNRKQYKFKLKDISVKIT